MFVLVAVSLVMATTIGVSAVNPQTANAASPNTTTLGTSGAPGTVATVTMLSANQSVSSSPTQVTSSPHPTPSGPVSAGTTENIDGNDVTLL